MSVNEGGCLIQLPCQAMITTKSAMIFLDFIQHWKLTIVQICIILIGLPFGTLGFSDNWIEVLDKDREKVEPSGQGSSNAEDHQGTAAVIKNWNQIIRNL